MSVLLFLLAFLWILGAVVGYQLYERGFRDYVGCATSAPLKAFHAFIAILLGPLSPLAAGLTLLSCPPERD